MHDASSDGDDISASINVTPFVDVVLVLLVIFMVTSDFIRPQAINIELPRAANGGEIVPNTINLVVARDGQVSLDGTPIQTDALNERLRSATANTTDRPQVVIAADRGVDYGRVISLIDLVKSHGIDDFALQIDRG